MADGEKLLVRFDVDDGVGIITIDNPPDSTAANLQGITYDPDCPIWPPAALEARPPAFGSPQWYWLADEEEADLYDEARRVAERLPVLLPYLLAVLMREPHVLTRGARHG